MITETVTRSPEETFAVGENLGKRLKGGEIILLFGDLGAGKTLFTKGVVSALGFDADEVTSPSFALVNLYRTNKHDIYHVDLWRIESVVDAAEAVGLSEFEGIGQNITIIEWPERLRHLPPHSFRVSILGDGDQERIITISDV